MIMIIIKILTTKLLADIYIYLLLNVISCKQLSSLPKDQVITEWYNDIKYEYDTITIISVFIIASL